MGDFDDGREMGLWGDDGIPYWDGDDEMNDSREKLLVELTPVDYLTKREKFKRFSAGGTSYHSEYGEMTDRSIFKIIHDRYNRNDDYALKVFADTTFIGYVRKKFGKYNRTQEINEFCFTNSEFNCLRIEYYGSKYKLVKCDNEYQGIEKSIDDILYKKRSCTKKDSEEASIENALKLKEKYNFSEEEIQELSKRLNQIRLEIVSTAGKELANEAIETTEKVLVQTSKFLGGLYKKYKESKNGE